MSNSKSTFTSFNELSVCGWYEKDERTLKSHPHAIIEALRIGESTKAILHLEQDHIWAWHEDMELEFIDWMLQLWNIDVSLNNIS